MWLTLSFALRVLFAATAATQGSHAHARMAPVRATAAPAVTFVHTKTRKVVQLHIFDAQGHMRAQALMDMRELLTDPRSRVDHPIHWRLASLLVAVAAHYPGRALEVVSGYRHANRHHRKSAHLRGRALDFRVQGVPNRELFDTLRASFEAIGVGYYPNSLFVHLDVREKNTVWVDYSGPGQTPCYSRHAEQDLRNGTAEQQTYAAAKRNGCRHP